MRIVNLKSEKEKESHNRAQNDYFIEYLEIYFDSPSIELMKGYHYLNVKKINSISNSIKCCTEIESNVPRGLYLLIIRAWEHWFKLPCYLYAWLFPIVQDINVLFSSAGSQLIYQSKCRIQRYERKFSRETFYIALAQLTIVPLKASFHFQLLFHGELSFLKLFFFFSLINF